MYYREDNGCVYREEIVKKGTACAGALTRIAKQFLLETICYSVISYN